MNGANNMNDKQDRVSAYLDGAMTPAEAAAFEQEIEGDAQLAAIVERWRRNDALLKTAFAVPETGGVSHSLLDRLGLSDGQAETEVIALDAHRQPGSKAHNDNRPSSKWHWGMAGSIAAGVAIMAAVSSFWTAEPSGMEKNSAFQAALNGSGSGITVALNDDQKVTPILSFEASDGRFCREFSVEGRAAKTQGVACKSDHGWQVEALVKGAESLPDNAEIRTAGGRDGAALDAVYSRLGASDPMSRSKEKNAISNGWKKK